MNKIKFTFPALFLVSMAAFLHAQQKPVLPLSLSNTVSGTLVADSTGIQLEALENQAAISSDLQEGGVSLNEPETGFQLEDDLLAARYDSLWLRELHENAALYEPMFQEVGSYDTLAAAHYKIDTELLKARLAKLDQKTPFNISYNPSLENVINSFLVRRKDLMERMITASQFYFPMFEEALDKYDIPLEIKYLAIIESALNPRAKSRVGATGLWQFMYGTGKMYDLEVNSYVDERSDPLKATEAACRYLSKLYSIFGDWDLALAAYNSGPGNVNKAIRRSGGYQNYWNIRRNLPRETAGYLPAFLATMYIFEYAAEHDLNIRKVERPYFETDTIHVKNTITFKQISDVVSVSEEELQILNPSYKLNIIPKVDGKTHILRLPKSAIGRFVNNEEAIYAYAEKELQSKESPLPQLVTVEDRIRYRVRSGDYLGKIAQQYGVGVSQLKRWNGLSGNDISVGQRLTIFTNKTGPATTPSPSETASGSSGDFRVHVVQKGDSLWTISKKYPGITIDKLKEWNGISGSNLQPGTKLKLCACSS